MSEFQADAWVTHHVSDHANFIHMIPVTVAYELDGHKPIGLWIYDETGADRTLDMTESEYDRLYEIARKKAAEDLVCAAEFDCEGER